ncbi:hypothetical protein VNI00_015091 [Paramarasmius palmivorus]|uniref:Myosin motor domain-containing protein n=1 Tax=Paramarasmius palmivorus TaxID=297713 RepID=A0AAW0BNR2_9AGAR
MAPSPSSAQAATNRQSTLIHQQLEQIHDLSQLTSISDDIIVACLRERFMSDIIYTSIGSNILVAFNPHKYVASNADSVMYKYAAEYRNTDREKEVLPPHVFQLANNAYYHMKRTTMDQVIVFSGDTSSGKSESRRLATKSLLSLSLPSPGKKHHKLSTQIPAADFVLESFGNARTLFNPNASRWGKYTELQFTDRGRICGVKTLEYYLEKSRVASPPNGERNFHIFYYLLAGASPEERAHLHLPDTPAKTHYRYLPRPSGTPGEAAADANKFEQLKHALKTIGFSKRHVAQTCQLLAAIIHLGNLEFVSDKSRNEDAAVVRNTDLLAVVADFLGVPLSELEGCLSYKSKLVKKEMCTIFLDPDAASDNRDDLARGLTFVALLDLPGPQNMTSRPNSLDQFAVNYAAERLHHFVQQSVFLESRRSEFAQEGLEVQAVPYFDNTECLRLLQNKPGGLIHIMDDQSRKMPKKTDTTMVEAFGKRWGSHSSFKVGGVDRSGFPTFTINHYFGSVTYSSEGFLEKNSHELNSDFVSLLRGPADALSSSSPSNAEGGSINPFVKGLFSGKAIAMQLHPRNEETIVGAQQNVKPMRAPSMRRKGTIRRAPTNAGNLPSTKEEEESPFDDLTPASTNAGKGGVAGEFRAALDQLLKHWGKRSIGMCFGQGRAFGLAEVARFYASLGGSGVGGMGGAGGWEVNMTEEEFVERYGDEAESVRESRGLGRGDVVLGATQISAVCDGVNGNLSPYVAFNPKNTSDDNTQYHDFRSFTNDSRPDWYFEQMVTMRYLARVGFLGYTPKEIKNMAHNSRSVGVYNGLIYDVTDYINSGPRIQPPSGFSAPDVASADAQFMDQKGFGRVQIQL